MEFAVLAFCEYFLPIDFGGKIVSRNQQVARQATASLENSMQGLVQQAVDVETFISTTKTAFAGNRASTSLAYCVTFGQWRWFACCGRTVSGKRCPHPVGALFTAQDIS
jgi:hypothetical protein